MNDESRKQFKAIIEQMRFVYKHDSRPWMIGYSGGKDSTLLCQLVFETLESLPPSERKKKVYIVTSDTMVENPIIRRYMHEMNVAINAASVKKGLNVESHIIYPEVKNRCWSLVVGLGYLTPEPPGFRWCTERLKILPSNDFTYNVIRKSGEIIILLGVRKAESSTRLKSIASREIEGKILTPHVSIPKAYTYRPLSEIENKDVWEYLLKDDGLSAWGTDNRYLFSLYQGEEMGEEQSVVGEVNKDKIAITGNSRFGCWCCTMVSEDKSLKNFIEHGASELLPLREFRNWLIELRNTPEARDFRRRNGSVYFMKNGELGRGPFTLNTRKDILRRLLQLQKTTGFELISEEELKFIDTVWEREGDLSCRGVVEIYYEVMGKRLPWDQFKKAKYDGETLETIRKLCAKHDVPFDLMSRLMSAVDSAKLHTRSAETTEAVEKVLNQGWLHDERVKEELGRGDVITQD